MPDRKPGVRLVTDPEPRKRQHGPLLTLTVHADDLETVLAAGHAESHRCRMSDRLAIAERGREQREALRRIEAEAANAKASR